MTFRRRAEIQVSCLAVEWAVIPGTDHEALARHARFQAHIVADGPSLKDVVPTANRVRWNFEIGVVIFNRPPLPEVIKVRMARPVREIGGKTRGVGRFEEWILGERQL